VHNILCHNHSAPCHVLPDPHAFLEMVAMFSTTTKILFDQLSPLHLDAEALYKIVYKGHSKGQLTALHAFHPDWFAHVLSSVTMAT